MVTDAPATVAQSTPTLLNNATESLTDKTAVSPLPGTPLGLQFAASR